MKENCVLCTFASAPCPLQCTKDKIRNKRMSCSQIPFRFTLNWYERRPWLWWWRWRFFWVAWISLTNQKRRTDDNCMVGTVLRHHSNLWPFSCPGCEVFFILLHLGADCTGKVDQAKNPNKLLQFHTTTLTTWFMTIVSICWITPIQFLWVSSPPVTTTRWSNRAALIPLIILGKVIRGEIDDHMKIFIEILVSWGAHFCPILVWW